MYKITTLGEEEVVLLEHDAVKPKAELVTVSLQYDIFLKQWTAFTGDVQEAVKPAWELFTIWNQTEVTDIERAKSTAYEAMMEYAEAQAIGPKDVVLCFKPMNLRAARDFKRGELILVPCAGHLSQLSPKESEHSPEIDVQVSDSHQKLWLSKPQQPVKAIDEWKAECLIPFFWVTSTAQQDDANMVFQKYNSNGVHSKCWSTSVL